MLNPDLKRLRLVAQPVLEEEGEEKLGQGQRGYQRNRESCCPPDPLLVLVVTLYFCILIQNFDKHRNLVFTLQDIQ